MNNNQQNKIALITGCSSGFGLLIACRLAQSGIRVIATMRNLEKKASLLEEAQKRGVNLDLIPLNVTDAQSIYSAKISIEQKYGQLTYLINNAGYGLGGFFEDLTEKEIRDQMETNFFGVQNVTRAFLPLLKKSANAKIISISSVSGFSTSPCFGAYNCSKWALEAFCESLRYELSLFNIDVLLINPGIYRTEIFDSNAHYAQGFERKNSPYYQHSQNLKQKITKTVENCKKDPEDIAKLVEKLIKAKNPPFRNMPDFASKILYVLRKVLPFKWYASMIKKAVLKKNP